MTHTSQQTADYVRGYNDGHKIGAAEEADAIAVWVRAEIDALITFYGYHGAEWVINALQKTHDGIRNDTHWVDYYTNAERQREQDTNNNATD